MPRPKKPKQLGFDPDPWLAKEQMKELVDNLNPYVSRVIPNVRPLQDPNKGREVHISLSRMQEELRSLVEQWQKSGPNLRKLFADRSDLRGWSTRRAMTLWPTSSGRGHLEWHEPAATAPKELAFELFFGLIANPNWEKLGGPCARCGRYYLKKTKRQKVYCSRRCGSYATAVFAIQRRRKEEYERRLRLARSELRVWGLRWRRLNWKRWISGRNPRLTLNCLTRMVNRGDLRSPESPAD